METTLNHKKISLANIHDLSMKYGTLLVGTSKSSHLDFDEEM